MSATPPDTGQQAALNGAPAREVSTAAASHAARSPGTGAPQRRLGLTLAVIATAQLMVVLDATIVNVALPHIQTALGFSGTNLEWVVNAYALAFGGLLLLGGRSGDLLGRRRVFIAGILVFSLASLLGGFATGQAWLLGARVVQGVGGALAAPTALSLIAVNFPEGPPRNRAMGVYAGMSVAGGAVGLLAGGLLVTFLSWRWVFFVNVPIGLAVALLAPRVLASPAAPRPVRPARRDHRQPRPGRARLRAVQRRDQPERRVALGRHQGDRLAGGRGGAAGGVRVHRGAQPARADADPGAAQPGPVRRLPGQLVHRHRAVRHVLLPHAVRAERVGVQPLRTGVSYLPMAGMILVASAAASQLVSRIGARPLMIAGSVVGTGGMFWLSRVTEHSHYVSGLLGPTLLTGTGLGLIFVPLSLVSLTKVANNARAWLPACSTSASSSAARSGWRCSAPWPGARSRTACVRRRPPRPPRRRRRPCHLSAAQAAALQRAAANHALATGFSQGYIVAAGIMALALVITLVTIRVRREDLSGVNPMAAPTD